jgi:hypothetical protein
MGVGRAGRARPGGAAPAGSHLATALLWRERGGSELVMATHDQALATAARASGFSVVGI